MTGRLCLMSEVATVNVLRVNGNECCWLARCCHAAQTFVMGCFQHTLAVMTSNITSTVNTKYSNVSLPNPMVFPLGSEGEGGSASTCTIRG